MGKGLKLGASLGRRGGGGSVAPSSGIGVMIIGTDFTIA